MATCSRCGFQRLSSIQCRHCRTVNPPGIRFCDQCGSPLNAGARPPIDTIGSERRHVTILFSDISRYREMINRVDPEELREVTRHLFERMGRIVNRYDGCVDRILWDGMLAVFGMPRTHEDDAIRAIRTALEIRQETARFDRRYALRIGSPLAIRSGVASGLVVTGSMEEENGRQGLTGDTVNLAARLRDLAAPGEVLVDSSAYDAAAGFFHFQASRPVPVKGRKRPVPVYRVQAAIRNPDKVRRLHGRKARLIARDRELKQMSNAAVRLRRREGTILSICGDAGTGKSRLIAEFKAAHVAPDVTWLDGHAYTYNSGVSYFPFIDMLNRRFGINEEDPDATIQSKLYDGVKPLVADPDAVVPFLSGLYAVSSMEHLTAGPEIYKSRLQQAFIVLLSALSRQGPTIVCIEDLHWADPSSLSLIRFILKESGLPILFLISYRPSIQFTSEGDQQALLSYAHEHIQLTDLDAPSSREMVRSLMGTQDIPPALDRYIIGSVEGNPFYLEEVVNSLVDANCLKRVGRGWELDPSVDFLAASSTINGIIHGRLERLGQTAKSILQEASVIGRVFRLSLLERITAFPDDIHTCIARIAQLDLIRRLPDEREPIYSFKHAIVQEVVYKGLLKKTRRVIHAKVARTLEAGTRDRLDGVVETLALHYANSDCSTKAAEFLIRSGEKSLKRYAVEESHRYYERAYRMLNRISRPTAEEQAMLIDLIVKWYFAFNKRGLFREMLDLLRSHEAMVRQFGDPLRTGMYEVCIGWALQRRELVTDSLDYLLRALQTGQQLGNDTLIAYSSACLCWTCTDLGRMDDGLVYGRQAAAVAARIGNDHELIRFNLTGMGLLHFFAGDVNACWRTGEKLIAFGETAGDERTFSEGYLLKGSARMIAGDFVQAEELLHKAIALSVDPIYSLNARFFLSYVYFSQGKVTTAARTLEAVIAATDNFGYEYVGTSASAFYGVVSASMGRLGRGVALIRARIDAHRKRGKHNHDLIFTHMLGRFYLALLQGGRPLNLRSLLANAGFLLFNRPVAARLAERYLKEAIAIGNRIHARQRLALACLDLGRLYTHKRRFDEARRQIQRSIELFDRCGADMLILEARAALAALPQ